ncbi:MBL fold metallo-hydrolase [Streptomyces acidicola]|uniref:MBL fold metallo-hydrolase n=1 Tax=Streptomyces acidicola TaxID=2596892 RepID=A0A5N8WTK4_9ACTN|nr:MBL fold metallo-hydrolase [Streptomyces acidicola]MPY50733.1 MBL fold metallo-hydrolase [Streptomyces acidicola]
MTQPVDYLANETWTVGDVTITKVVESSGPFPIELLDPIVGAERVRSVKTGPSWQRPYYLSGNDEICTPVHSFLIQTPTKRIVVDTGVGDDRERDFEGFRMLKSGYLDRFGAVWDPESVDYVVSTHLHVDHCGWNTRLENARWVPTFPNARYLFIKAEYDAWKALAADPDASRLWDPTPYMMLDIERLFSESMLPIHEAGLVDWTEPDAVLTPEVRLIPTHGHTPGHVSVLVESGGQSTVMSGDLFHGACQVAHPEWHDQLDIDRPKGMLTRAGFLERFADTSTMVLFTHIGPSPAAYIKREGGSYRLEPAGA